MNKERKEDYMITLRLRIRAVDEASDLSRTESLAAIALAVQALVALEEMEEKL